MPLPSLILLQLYESSSVTSRLGSRGQCTTTLGPVAKLGRQLALLTKLVLGWVPILPTYYKTCRSLHMDPVAERRRLQKCQCPGDIKLSIIELPTRIQPNDLRWTDSKLFCRRELMTSSGMCFLVDSKTRRRSSLRVERHAQIQSGFFRFSNWTLQNILCSIIEELVISHLVKKLYIF